MLKKTALGFFLLIMVISYFPNDVLAGSPATFGRKITVKNNRVALQHSIYNQNRGMTFTAKVGQKLFSNLSLNTDWALGAEMKPYLGLDLHATVFINDLLSIGCYAGVHFGGFENGEDFGMTLFFDPINQVGVFLAYDRDFNSSKETHLCFGIDVPVAKNMGFSVNYEKGIQGTSYNGFSSGLIFFF